MSRADERITAYENLYNSMVADGRMSHGEAVRAIATRHPEVNAARNEAVTEASDRLRGARARRPGFTEAPAAATESNPEGQWAAKLEALQATGLSAEAATRTLIRKDPDLHRDYINAHNARYGRRADFKGYSR